MAFNQERNILEVESGSDYSEAEGSTRTRTPFRVGLVVALGVAVVFVVNKTSVFGPIKAKVDSLIGKAEQSQWVNTGVFTPETLPDELKPSQAQAPSENTQDGNTCNDDEELFEGLCYKKCSLLTQGTHPIRTTSMSCCNADKAADCNFKNQEVSVKICGGYDVAGNVNGQTSACPHAEGGCYENEELFLGQCYKKCSEVAGAEYTKRITSWSCCKASDMSDCNPFGENVKSSTDFAVSGEDTSTNSISAHAPIKSIDEAGSSTASTASTAATAASTAAAASTVSAASTAFAPTSS